jgi:D-glycero-alpha-D-manno-heptose 1-phosphate guanylyltransferase
MEAVILAGGLGTRLRGVVGDIPKPMADINGKPFLDYLMSFAVSKGVGSFVLSVGHRREVIKDYFKSSFNGVPVVYAEETEPLGTGGAIKKSLEMCKDENVFVFNGDTFFPMDLAAAMDGHLKSGALFTMALKTLENFDRYGVVSVDETGRTVTGFEEKTFRSSGRINAGVYILSRKILPLLPPEKKFSFEKDFMEKSPERLRIGAFVSGAYFIDIGVPEDYERAKREFKNAPPGMFS